MQDHFAPPPPTRAEPLGILLDVTLRDGGFEVDFHWPDDVYRVVPAALAPLGVEIVELGYLGGVPLEHSVARPGIGADLAPEHIAAARRPGLRLAAMVHPSALERPLDLAPYVEAGLDMLRLVFHPTWFTGIVTLAARARDLRLATTVNIALASRYTRAELLQHATSIQQRVQPDVLYVADTCGAMLPHQVHDLVSRLADTVEAEIGFHAHDFLSLAYANTLAAVDAGATHIDCSLLGLGRGGGNLGAELVLLRHRMRHHSDREAIQDLLDCRTRLGEITRRAPQTLVPAVCGVLNLTPPEEQALRDFAEQERVDLDLAAIWLAGVRTEINSLRPYDLRAAWQERHLVP